ncbi:hypothetical protein [Saccharopolyspora sp. CA-218241]|uniref:hypothetical protein n=1 Tax=Saccharopolyspora sp. CA-218241 TaxID=3240027 RepID=UPI003D96260C
MRLVRLDAEPSAVGADVRAAVTAWGEGESVLGGVAVFGCAPLGAPRPLDAVLVLPRGVVVVLGADLGEPATKLEAPLRTPWTVDGWPLVRDGAANPGLEALESAAALARGLQARGVEPLPVAAVVAVGPYAAQVTQPTTDLHRGLRVLSPTTTSVLAAARELATYERTCPAAAAHRLLRALDGGIDLSAAELVAEGFADTGADDLGTTETVLLPKVRAAPRRPLSRRRSVVGGAVAAVVLACAVVLVVLLTGGPEPAAPARAVRQVDGVGFVEHAARRGTDCVAVSSGDVQAWFAAHPCREVSRARFATRTDGRPVVVAVTSVDAGDERSAAELRELAQQPGTGQVGVPLTGNGAEFDDAARAVQQTGARVRVVRAVWGDGPSAPEDVALRTAVERGLRLPL